MGRYRGMTNRPPHPRNSHHTSHIQSYYNSSDFTGDAAGYLPAPWAYTPAGAVASHHPLVAPLPPPVPQSQATAQQPPAAALADGVVAPPPPPPPPPPPAFISAYAAAAYYPTPYYRYDTKEIREMVKAQIEYYFSDENLIKDVFLRQKMDKEGYVTLSAIASFPRVQSLTRDMDIVINACRDSQLIDLSTDAKIRPKNEPLKWPFPDALQPLQAQPPPPSIPPPLPPTTLVAQSATQSMMQPQLQLANGTLDPHASPFVPGQTYATAVTKKPNSSPSSQTAQVSAVTSATTTAAQAQAVTNVASSASSLVSASTTTSVEINKATINEQSSTKDVNVSVNGQTIDVITNGVESCGLNNNSTTSSNKSSTSTNNCHHNSFNNNNSKHAISDDKIPATVVPTSGNGQPNGSGRFENSTTSPNPVVQESKESEWREVSRRRAAASAANNITNNPQAANHTHDANNKALAFRERSKSDDGATQSAATSSNISNNKTKNKEQNNVVGQANGSKLEFSSSSSSSSSTSSATPVVTGLTYATAVTKGPTPTLIATQNITANNNNNNSSKQSHYNQSNHHHHNNNSFVNHHSTASNSGNITNNKTSSIRSINSHGSSSADSGSSVVSTSHNHHNHNNQNNHHNLTSNSNATNLTNGSIQQQNQCQLGNNIKLPIKAAHAHVNAINVNANSTTATVTAPTDQKQENGHNSAPENKESEWKEVRSRRRPIKKNSLNS